jgi:hypothetical protein
MANGRGVSTLLGAIILIGIAVVAGASVFNVANQYAIVGFSKTEYSVIEASITSFGTDNQCLLHAKLMNTGTKNIASMEVEVNTDRIPENLQIDKDSTFTFRVSTPDRTFFIWTTNNTFSISLDKPVDPSEIMEIDSLVFTNMTGEIISTNSKDFLTNRLQPLFNECAPWKECTTYTMDVHARTESSDETGATVTHLLQCREEERF